MGWLCENGHVAATRELRLHGHSERQLARAVEEGQLIRVATGVYACPHISSDARTAATARVDLDCVSLLGTQEDQWVGARPTSLHVRARAGRHHGTLPTGTVVHWSRSRPPGMVGALISGLRCLSPLDWLAAVESALHLRTISPFQLEVLTAAVPGWARDILSRLDRGAQSGLETHTRCKLIDAGFSVVSQVYVPAAGKIDLLVEDCVGIETDGGKWHAERFLADRTKDIIIEGWSIRVLRVGAPHIFEWWDDTLTTIERMVTDARRGRLHTFAPTRRGLGA